MIFYNPYSEIYTILIIQALFKANGLITIQKTEYWNIARNYYDFSKTSNVVRLVCEILYVVILFLYIFVEIS